MPDKVRHPIEQDKRTVGESRISLFVGPLMAVPFEVLLGVPLVVKKVVQLTDQGRVLRVTSDRAQLKIIIAVSAVTMTTRV